MNITFATSPGSPTTRNEDWVGSTQDVAVLLDGVSTPPGLDVGCRHGTRWYVRALGLQLLDRVTFGTTLSLTDCLRDAIAAVADMHEECDLSHPGSPSATIAMLRTTATSVDYLVLADTAAVVDTGDEIHVLTDDRVTRAAPELRAAALREPIGSEEHARRRRAMVETQRRRRNVAGGYWVAATDPRAAAHAMTGSLPRAPVRRAALLSDGASALVLDYQLADWKGLLDLAQDSGPDEVIHRVREAESSDPVGERWPRLKQSDDATVMFCRISPV